MATDIYQQADNGMSDLFGDDDFQDDGQDNTDSIPPSSGPGAFEGNDELGELMRAANVGGDFNWEALNEMKMEQGEKADDAQDYMDIGDDDSLPDEEMADGGANQSTDQLLPGISENAMDNGEFNDDDLFGPSSPTENPFESKMPNTTVQQTKPDDHDSDIASDNEGQEMSMFEDEQEPEISEEDMAQWRIQQQLFAQSGKGYAPATMDENIDEWLKLEFPDFKRDQTPFWTKLLPPKPQRYQLKTPAKPPKTVRPSKANLEIETDEKTLFASAVASATSVTPRVGIVKAVLMKTDPTDGQTAEDSDTEEPLPGGISMQDLDFFCTDFDTLSHAGFSDSGVADLSPDIGAQAEDDDNDLFMDDFRDSVRPNKKRRLGLDPREIVAIHHLEMPSFDDPEEMTAGLAQQVVLDLNDPALLVEELDMDTIRTRVRPGEKVVDSKSVKERLKNRFKTSNDGEYDLLKQNHQQKVRGLLGHMTIDHSLPAIRLQWPYYKVKLQIDELRNYHRTRLTFRQPITFSKLVKIKKKERKGKPAKEVYTLTKDLSLGDNSSALLLEYSEEHPIMLSQTGMGNKIVNYYRRRTADDTSRPKGEIGETNVLLTEDKSPFHAFGPIDAGETVTALYNSMYRAPIFEHPNKPQDFLVVRESTGCGGFQHYLRSIDHTYVVGQELPSVTVPGTHSRMVTTASKNRLKAISFRIARRKKSNRIRVEEVTKHFPDTSDMQNRQKMKEFMVFSKEHKEWEMRTGEDIPNEEAIQQLIKPEDICLLESMQVGHQYLQDAGYADNDEDEDDTKENDTDSIEQQLAPWKTTKNFLQATQGKAMLKLYGEGDPSGRGEAFSFVKTSMKGGFKAVGGSVQDTIAMKKELGGHSYNVARQQKSYEESIRGIWDRQKASLSSNIEPSDFDDDGVDGQVEDYTRNRDVRATPASGTPAPSRRRDDETVTSFSKRSAGSQVQRYLTISRTVIIDGEPVEQTEVISDPSVIKQYTKIKEAEEARVISVLDIEPTGNQEFDERAKKRIQDELNRLEKAKARRNQRDKTKAALNAASPGAAGSPDGDSAQPSGRQVQATQRKCANCGQVGHIKTNKKLCPMLNGTIKHDDQFNNAAFMGAPPALP